MFKKPGRGGRQSKFEKYSENNFEICLKKNNNMLNIFTIKVWTDSIKVSLTGVLCNILINTGMDVEKGKF